MSTSALQDVRNVAIVGHGDSGKTSLADRLLFVAGAVARAGSVREKTSHFDYEVDEKERGHSISVAVGHCEWKGKAIRLVDTPGYPDFLGDAVLGINGTDCALLCVNAHSGVMVNTKKLWRLLESAKRPVAIVVTKCDQEPGKLPEVYAKIRTAFGERCLAWRAPAQVPAQPSAWIEAVVEADDEAMMKYLESGGVEPGALAGLEATAFAKRLVFPVLFVSSEKNEGTKDVLDFLAELAPSPLSVKRRVYPRDRPEETGALMAATKEAPFLGFVWKIQTDKHVGKIAQIRVIQGVLKPGDTITNLRADKKEKCHHIFHAQGKEQQMIDQALPGDLIVLTKLDSLHVGDTLSAHPGDLQVELIPIPRPMYSLAVLPKARGDEAKISEALARIADECPTFHPYREPLTHEQLVAGMSQLHLDLMLRRVRDRYGVEVVTHKPKIPYREFVTGTAEGHYRHKKQSGGRGQFAEVHLAVLPGEPNEGLKWSWDIFGGSVPRNFEPAIEKGVREKMQSGVVAGFPLLDVKVSIRDGKYHDVDSSEAAFKIAGGRAFLEAVHKARPIVLEPMMRLTITIPSHFMGDVSGDLNTRRGRIVGMSQEGDDQVLSAEMPMAEASEYARALTALTSGEGSFTMESSHYDPVPASVQAQLVAAHQPKHDDD